MLYAFASNSKNKKLIYRIYAFLIKVHDKESVVIAVRKSQFHFFDFRNKIRIIPEILFQIS